MTANPVKTRLLPILAISAALMSALPAGAAVIEELHAQVPQEFINKGINVAVFNDWAPDEFVEDGELKGA